MSAVHSDVKRQNRVNPEHKSCFKSVFCFNLRLFRVDFTLIESVMYPITRIIKNFFHRVFKYFLNKTDVQDLAVKLLGNVQRMMAQIYKSVEIKPANKENKF